MTTRPGVTLTATRHSQGESSKRWFRNPEVLASYPLAPPGSVGARICVHDICVVLHEAASMLTYALSLWIAQVLLLSGTAPAL